MSINEWQGTLSEQHYTNLIASHTNLIASPIMLHKVHCTNFSTVHGGLRESQASRPDPAQSAGSVTILQSDAFMKGWGAGRGALNQPQPPPMDSRGRPVSQERSLGNPVCKCFATFCKQTCGRNASGFHRRRPVSAVHKRLGASRSGGRPQFGNTLKIISYVSYQTMIMT